MVLLFALLFGLTLGCDELLNTCCFLPGQHTILVSPPPFKQLFPPNGVQQLKTNRSTYLSVYFQLECYPIWADKETFDFFPNIATFYWAPSCSGCLPAPPSVMNISFVGRNKCRPAPTLTPAHNTTTDGSKKPIGAIIGGTLGGGIACLGIGVVFFLVKKHFWPGTAGPMVRLQEGE